MLVLSKHGYQRLYERIQAKAQVKTSKKALEFLNKVIKKGLITVNDTNQLLVNYAESLYVFKKDSTTCKLVFVTVKTSEQSKICYYSKGKRCSYSFKKDFSLAS